MTARTLLPAGLQTATSSRWRWLVPPAVVLLLYTAVGFLLVPRLIERQIVGRAQTSLARVASVEDVRFNPFTLAATLTGLRLQDRDGETLAAVDRVYANLGVSGVFRWAIRFQEIAIERPLIHARILADARPSVADLFERNTAEAPGEQAPFELPRLIVDRLAVNGGMVEFSDGSVQPVYNTRFEPLHLDVTNLVTLPDQSGAHTIALGVGDGGTLRWSGTQTFDPLRFNGQFEITALELEGFWAYLARDLPLQLHEGRANLVLPYDVHRRDDGRYEMKLQAASAALEGLALGPSEGGADWLTVPGARVDGVDVAWPAARVDVAAVRITSPSAVVRIGEDGAINWAALAPASEAETPAESSWTVNVGSIAIEDGLLAFEDDSVQPGVRAGLNGLSVETGQVTTDASASVPVEVSARVGERGTVQLAGNLVRSPLDVTLGVNVQGIDLAPVRPYLRLSSGASIGAATAGLEGRLAIPGSVTAMTFSGTGTLDGVTIVDAQGDEVVTWARLAATGVEIDEQARQARFNRLSFERPYARIHIDRDGNLNLSRLTASAAGTPATDVSGEPRRIEAGVVEFRNSSAEFTDESLILPFMAQIHSANGTLRDVSSFAAAPATLAIEGRVDETGYVKVDGTLRTGDPFAASEILVGFRDIEMLGLTPYFAQFAGYAVRSGTLDLDVNYVVKDRRLVGNHKVVARDLVLGDRVKDSKAPSLPIRLAVALLKDRQGRINLDVPIEGDVDSPQFAYRTVFWSAVRTILGNAATAPFRALGRLFGRDEDDLELVEFDPGRSDLLPAERDTLVRLAEQIAPRAELTVAVEGRFDQAADTGALKRITLERLIESRREAAAAAAAAAGGSTLERILEELFVEQFSPEALEQERQRFTQPAEAPAPTAPAEAGAAPAGVEAPAAIAGVQAPAAPPAVFDAAGFYESLRARLLEAQAVETADLAALASARANAIVAALTEASGVDPARLSVRPPTTARRSKAGSTRIASEMSMSAGVDDGE